MLTAIREVQIPLLAAMLLGACLAKAWRALRPHAHPAVLDADTDEVLGPTGTRESAVL
jgi:hypothetical protein